METVQDQSCSIHIGENAIALADQVPLQQGNGGNCIILCEKNASEYILPILNDRCPNLRKHRTYFLDASEKNKQIETIIPLWEQWIADGIDRKTVVINLGGGVLCDMGGFAASIFKRGIPFIHIPTTLLSMTDASVGGKTAVDFQEVKNALGVFSRPLSVIIDPVFLHTLPKEEMLSGQAEILKMMLIGKKDFHIEEVGKIFEKPDALMESVIFSIKEKARITSIDFKEENIRRTLNFGHTFGHAFESLALKQNRPISHGRAVAHGMVCEIYLSWMLCGLDRKTADEIAGLILKHYGIFQFQTDDIPDLISYMENDKKNHDGKIYPIMLTQTGECRYDQAVTPGIIEKVLQNYPLF